MLAAWIAGCVALTGCYAAPNAADDPTSFDAIVASAIDEAKAGGAGDAQMEILRRSQSAGAVSLEDDRTAVRAMVQCVIDAGSDAYYNEQTDPSGLVIPGYGAAANNDAQMAIGDACDVRESFWVSMVYQTQPTSVGVNTVYLDQQAPIVRSCLEREGYTTDPGETTHELLRQATQVKLDTNSAVDCLAEASIQGY